MVQTEPLPQTTSCPGTGQQSVLLLQLWPCARQAIAHTPCALQVPAPAQQSESCWHDPPSTLHAGKSQNGPNWPPLTHTRPGQHCGVPATEQPLKRWAQQRSS